MKIYLYKDTLIALDDVTKDIEIHFHSETRQMFSYEGEYYCWYKDDRELYKFVSEDTYIRILLKLQVLHDKYANNFYEQSSI